MFIVISGTMHGHDSFLGKEVIHDRKDSFLYLTGIQCSSYDDQLFLKIAEDECAGSGTISFRVSLEVWSCQYSELRLMIFQFLFRWSDKHIVRKQTVISSFTDHANV